MTPSHSDSDHRDQSDNPPCVAGMASPPTGTLELLHLGLAASEANSMEGCSLPRYQAQNARRKEKQAC